MRTLEIELVDVAPALLWAVFGPHGVRADLIHDACWDGEAIR